MHAVGSGFKMIGEAGAGLEAWSDDIALIGMVPEAGDLGARSTLAANAEVMAEWAC